MQKTTNLYIAEVEGDAPVLIKASTEAEAIQKLASHDHNKFYSQKKNYEVFELALENMKNREQMIELYETFFGDTISLFGIVNENIYHSSDITVL